MTGPLDKWDFDATARRNVSQYWNSQGVVAAALDAAYNAQIPQRALALATFDRLTPKGQELAFRALRFIEDAEGVKG